MKLRVRLAAALVATAIAVAAIAPAAANSVTLNDGSCIGAGGSTFGPGVGLAYTSGCSNHQRYLSTYWQYSGGYVNAVYGWKVPPGDWNQFEPLGGGATYIFSSHNLCTNSYSACNGYVNTSAP
jgi:hypothetical protein